MVIPLTLMMVWLHKMDPVSLFSSLFLALNLLLGKFLGALYTVIMALGLQVDIQQHTQPLQLVGQELVTGPRAAELPIAHIDFTLHSLWGWEASTSATDPRYG